MRGRVHQKAWSAESFPEQKRKQVQYDCVRGKTWNERAIRVKAARERNARVETERCHRAEITIRGDSVEETGCRRFRNRTGLVVEVAWRSVETSRRVRICVNFSSQLKAGLAERMNEKSVYIRGERKSSNPLVDTRNYNQTAKGSASSDTGTGWLEYAYLRLVVS